MSSSLKDSKKYDYVDDYAYMNAYYENPLNLNTADRQLVEYGLREILTY